MNAALKRGYLITGASRGLGYALAASALQAGATVVGLARHAPEGLGAVAEKAGAGYHFVALDLADTTTVLTQVDRLWAVFDGTWDGLYLINNAATVQPVAPADRCDARQIVDATAINLIAAMLLTSSFVRATQGHARDRRVLNISSGAARKAYPSWSAYCATKAALDRYTQCVGMEQEARSGGVRIASIAPGIIDTDMQAVARSTPEADFPLRQQFIDYYRKGELASADSVARKLLQILHGDGVRFGNLLNIHDFS